jgi:hypothetical protein
MYNKNVHNYNSFQIINKPFLNLIYFHFTFFKFFIKNMGHDLDKAESIFSRDVYGYVKTKDGKFVSIGNLENKFQENMKNILDKIQSDDGQKQHEYEEEENKKQYDLDSIQNIMANRNRDEIFVKFYNTETCVTPVLSIEEAIQFTKNLNKSINLSARIKNSRKLECLNEIEEYFFSNLKNTIIVDLNPKIYTFHNQSSTANLKEDSSISEAKPKF